MIAAVLEDITERKKIEKELWNAKKDWERTFGNVPDFVAIIDNQLRIVGVAVNWLFRSWA